MVFYVFLSWWCVIFYGNDILLLVICGPSHGHNFFSTWWHHQMEAFSALLTLCAGNSPATGKFPTQRPVTRSFDVFIDLRLNKRLSKHLWGWWYETPLCSLWRQCNEMPQQYNCQQCQDMCKILESSMNSILFREKGNHCEIRIKDENLFVTFLAGCSELLYIRMTSYIWLHQPIDVCTKAYPG